MSPRTVTPDLPAVLAAHLDAHVARDIGGELACYAVDAVVIDDGRTYRGKEQIRAWLGRAASEYSYMSELTAVRQDAPDRWTATHHLEGDFPGGTVDLHYRYVLRDALVAELVIAP